MHFHIAINFKPPLSILQHSKRYAGHSKWAKIRHNKGATDLKRGQVFSAISKDIISAVKEGGSDAKYNLRLAAAIKQAKEVDMPKDNIDRAIKRATSKEYSNAELIVYEGLGPHGVALIIECLTENKNRTVKSLRNKFNRMGGSMAPVSYMFDKKGCIWFTCSPEKTQSLDTMFEHAIEAGAEDINEIDNNGTNGNLTVEIICEFTSLQTIATLLSTKYGYPIEKMESTYIPNTTISEINAEQESEITLAIEDMEELDDVLKVHSNMSS